LYYYRKIEEGARGFLKPGGHIFFEMDDRQAGALRLIFGDGSAWTGLRVSKDYSGRDRVFAARKVTDG
jgi:methylase of polypeptide subunit release factors